MIQLPYLLCLRSLGHGDWAMSPDWSPATGAALVYLCGPTVSGSPPPRHGSATSSGTRCAVPYLERAGGPLRVQRDRHRGKIIAARRRKGKLVHREVAARYEALWWDTILPLASSAPTPCPRHRSWHGMVGLVADWSRRLRLSGRHGVYFSSESLPGNGLLARQDVGTLARPRPRSEAERMRASARHWTLPVEVWPRGEPAGPFAVGAGRPGWHYRVAW